VLDLDHRWEEPGLAQVLGQGKRGGVDVPEAVDVEALDLGTRRDPFEHPLEAMLRPRLTMDGQCKIAYPPPNVPALRFDIATDLR
jgi:hypothetical protein